MPLKEKIDRSRLPRHIAIIMDGNGRWAKARHLPRVFGHRAGMKTVREIIDACSQLKVEVLTLYAFSTENWIRPKSEVQALMSLMRTYIRKELANLQKNNIRVKAIGDITALPAHSYAELQRAIDETAQNTGMILNLALNYGGRQEIVRAVNALIAKGTQTVTEADMQCHLFTAGIPDPDLLIRTSGEMRLSNFLLWQIAYTELYITDTLWPNFHSKNLYEAILDYQRRERRFGGINSGL